MKDVKKYYYIKLKEDFFESNEIKILESMQDGYLYSNILLKLYLKSLKDNGKLTFSEHIPYNSQMLAAITNHQVGTIEKAIKAFKELGLIEILDTGTIYMLDIQNFIGQSSNEADRIRAYRESIKSDIELNKAIGNSKSVTNVRQMNDICTTDIRDKILEKKEVNTNVFTKKKENTFTPPTVDEVKEYCKQRNNNIDAELFVAFYESKGWYVGKNKMKSWKSAIVTWEKSNKRTPANTSYRKEKPLPDYMQTENTNDQKASTESLNRVQDLLKDIKKANTL